MAKTINFTIDGKDYVLEFTRNTVIATENMGFNVYDVYTKPVGSLLTLWRGAFLANHGTTTIDERDELLRRLKRTGKENGSSEDLGLLDALIELYRAPVASLFDENEENSKNVVEWTIN